MSSSPWTITSTKRKSKSSTPAPRKRPRLSEPQGGSNARMRSQRTLTQAQWLTPAPNSTADYEAFLEDTRQPQTVPQTRVCGRLKKRDSTLTQMDFFNAPLEDQDDIDDTLLLPDDGNNDAMLFTQLDGAYSSPRKPRKRKASTDPEPPLDSKEVQTERESQEYRPITKKRTIQKIENEAVTSGRRISRRLASKKQIFSDPAQSFEYFDEALTTPSRNGSSEAVNRKSKPVLEIKDSVDDEDEISNNIYSVSKSADHLRTPTKDRVIILSSQSPESLPPSTRKRIRTGLRSPKLGRRTPLAERAINLSQASPTKLASKTPGQGNSNSPMTKMVVLKLSKRRERQHVPCVEDSQKDPWSIPSSSPEQRLKDDLTSPKMQPPPRIEPSSHEAEIPATSQIQTINSSSPLIATQDSLPNIVDIIGCKKNKASHVEESLLVHTGPASLAETGTIVRDFALAPEDDKTVDAAISKVWRDDVALADVETVSNPPVNVRPMVVEDSEDEGDISPLKQPFNVSFEHGAQSLAAASSNRADAPTSVDMVSTCTPSPSVPPMSARSPERATPEESLANMDELPQTPLPVPQLVSQSTTKHRHGPQSEPDMDLEEVTLPKPPFIHQSSTHMSTTLVPLNDMHSRSSSPSLPSAKTITQKSVNPASMPHPSQVSTQDATQGLLNMSSYPRPFLESYVDERSDKITIKDSSSCQVAMSQLPQHMWTTQSQHNIDLGLDEVLNSDEEGDLDLDPPSTPSQQNRHAFSEIEIERTPTKANDMPVDKEAGDIHMDVAGGEMSDSQAQNQDARESPIPSSQRSISITSSPNPPPLQKKYDPIPGFNNDTQSNFTQNGHVTAAYIHRQREAGVLLPGYTPVPFQVPGYTRRK